MEEPSHKRYLNDYFTGKIAGSISRGELYNDDPVTQDARFVEQQHPCAELKQRDLKATKRKCR